MAVAYFMFRAARAIREIGSAELFESYQVVRDLYTDVNAWTGLAVSDLLDEDVPEKPEIQHNVLAIRSLANHLSLADILSEKGLKPSALVGFSIGLISASCLSG